MKSLRGLERKYQRELAKLGKALTKAVRVELLPYLKAQQPGYVADSLGADLATIFRKLNQQFTGTMAISFAQTTATNMVEETGRKNKAKFDRSVKVATGVDLGSVVREEGLQDFIELSVNKNVSLIKSLPEEYLKSVETIVNNGVIEGTRFSEIAKKITARTGSANSKLANRIRTIARNEVSTLNAQISQRRSENLGITRGIWRTSEDESVRECHVKRNGKEYNISKGLYSNCDGKTIKPGEEINCLPGDSYLDNNSFCEKLYRRWYAGKLTELVFDDGEVLRITPKHPIFTTKGIKPAQFINRGDDIVRTIEKGNCVGELNSQSYKTSFEDIFRAFDLAGVEHCVSSNVVGKFHGDISDSDVNIINIDSLLANEVNPLLREKIAKLNFPRADKIRNLPFLSCNSGSDTSGFFSGFSSNSLMGFFDLITSRLLVHLTPLELFGFALGSWCNTASYEFPPDNGSGSAKMFSDCVFAFAALVHGQDVINKEMVKLSANLGRSGRNNKPCLADISREGVSPKAKFFGTVREGETIGYKLDSIIDNRTRNFNGHVYNLQTVSGNYNTSATVVSNCRCSFSPIITFSGRGEIV